MARFGGGEGQPRRDGPGRDGVTVGLPRRRLLIAGAGLLSTAGLGAVGCEASRPDPAQPRTTAMAEAPARRTTTWQTKVAVPRPEVMTAAGGVVYVAGDQGVDWTPDASGVLQALTARDGRHMWTYTVPMGGRGTVLSDPPGMAAGEGYVVYFAANDLTCLRAGDGAKLWSDSSPLTVNLAAGPDAVYAVQETLFALSSRHGTRLWSFAADAGATDTPLLADGALYVSGLAADNKTGVMLAIRPSDGTKLWESPGSGGWLAGDGKTVCAVAGIGPDVQVQGNGGPFPSQLSTYRASDGKLLYRSAFSAGYGPPVMTAGMAFAINAGNGHTPAGLHAVDPGNGRTVWSYPGTSVTPAAAHGRIYTASPAGDLIALNASDGTPVWQCPIRFTLGPVVAGNTVYVCDNTTLYAVRA
jgi:outer membrane protein assembly factor BamB